MNPARSLGPAIVHNEYKGIWIYLVSPTLGAVAGTWAYNFIRYTNKPVHEITKSASFLKGGEAEWFNSKCKNVVFSSSFSYLQVHHALGLKFKKELLV